MQCEPVWAAAGVEVEPEDGRARRGPHGGTDPREDRPTARRDLVQLKAEIHATSSTKLCINQSAHVKHPRGNPVADVEALVRQHDHLEWRAHNYIHGLQQKH